MELILLALLIRCAVGWLNSYVCRLALILFMMEKKYTPPSGKELEACMREVWIRVLHLK